MYSRTNNVNLSGLGENFCLRSRQSSKAVTAVLSQSNEATGQLHPIDFFLLSLSKAQENYCAGQLEDWALVAACRKWSIYLRALGEVELITDHCSLKMASQSKGPAQNLRDGS